MAIAELTPPRVIPTPQIEHLEYLARLEAPLDAFAKKAHSICGRGMMQFIITPDGEKVHVKTAFFESSKMGHRTIMRLGVPEAVAKEIMLTVLDYNMPEEVPTLVTETTPSGAVIYSFVILDVRSHDAVNHYETTTTGNA